MTEKELLNWIKGYCSAVLNAISDRDDDLFNNTKFIKPIMDKIYEYESAGTSCKQLLNEQLSEIIDLKNKVWYSTLSNEVALDPTESLETKYQSEK